MKHKTSGIVLFLVLLSILIACLSAVLCFLFFAPNDSSDNNGTAIDSEVATKEQPEPEPLLPDAVDFQPIVDEWVASVRGNRSVLIYDLDRDELVASYNPDEGYSTASLYKLFIVYEGYRRLDSGVWMQDDPVDATSYSVIECLDLAIRESYSPCAESLLNMIGRQEMEDIIVNEYGISDSNITGLWSNPNDVLKMMKIYYKHADIQDDSLIAMMQDSFLNQPATEYDWRQGLPSGFSRADVYNKVGWEHNPDTGIWDIYHDAAIIEFPEAERHFIVVVMTNGVSFSHIARLGSMVEDAFYNQYVLKN